MPPIIQLGGVRPVARVWITSEGDITISTCVQVEDMSTEIGATAVDISRWLLHSWLFPKSKRSVGLIHWLQVRLATPAHQNWRHVKLYGHRSATSRRAAFDEQAIRFSPRTISCHMIWPQIHNTLQAQGVANTANCIGLKEWQRPLVAQTEVPAPVTSWTPSQKHIDHIDSYRI